MKSILAVAKQFASGRVSSAALIDAALARIADATGEGARVFTKVYAESARDFARAADRAHAHGVIASPLAGLPISIKDLFDVRGEPTPAGSKLLANAAPATADAIIVARLRAAGAVLVGRTNMTEFAYSGIGINPHYGTPRNPFERKTPRVHQGYRANGRVPGGSSSGAAVSVTDEMAIGAIGTDTGGSVRIPAAFCGLTGFKPTARRVPRDGALPLSTSLDSIGPIAPSVACCALLDAVMAGEPPNALQPLPPAGLRLGIVRDFVLDNLEPAVASAFERTLATLSAAGMKIVDLPFAELHRLPMINKAGGFAGAEAYAWHRDYLATRLAEYDPRVSRRILGAQSMSAADYIALGHERAAMIALATRLAAPFDALLLPSVAITAPYVADLERDDEAFGRANGLSLRNTSVFNFLDGCGLSIPCHRTGDAPVGLMVVGMAGQDAHVLRVGATIEPLVSPAFA